ncbi:MAG TPA: hypothetical protein VEW47_12605 [Candidatus Dormibacteraeota bacterium]|nr:hypothetical protein [Candidatus Dormibacteraeota bacterium]
MRAAGNRCGLSMMASESGCYLPRTRVLLSIMGSLVLLSAASPHAEFDACSIITRAEIEAVQGEPVTDTKSSAPDRPVFTVAQCFYTVATFSKSVSLEVTRRDPKNPAEDSPRDQWKKLFHPAVRKNDDEKGSSPPLVVKGVGAEAFWMGNAISGGLYVLVLENDTYFRISLGGSEEGPVKIEKAKTLARRAIPRLRGNPPG